MYKKLRIESCNVYGVMESITAMRRPKGTKGDSMFLKDGPVLGERDIALARNLVRAGTDHGKFTRGINAYFVLHMQTGFMIEFETYRHGVECLSTSSSMHGELKHLSGKELAAQKQRDLVEKVYTRDVVISYQALRAMYRARRNHRHPDWRIFCNAIERMPFFDVFIFPEYGD